MRFAIKNLSLIACLTVTSVTPAIAVDLKSAYQAALGYDAELLAAKASRDETAEGVPVARSALLPQVGYSTQWNKVDTLTSYLYGRYPSSDSGKYDSESSTLSFRQTLFRKPAWDALQVAKAQADAADASFQDELQNAGLRVVSSYLEVLNAREGLALAKKATIAMGAWLNLAEKSYAAGRGTRTDIEDAKSRRDMSKAKETEAQMALSSAARNFEVFSGISANNIPEINPKILNPDLMQISNKEQWLLRIEDSSPQIQSLRKQLEAARSNVAQARGGHLPTVDFVAAHQYSKSDTNYTVGVAYKTDYIGLQVNIPILNGGGVTAQARQAVAREERVRQALESTRRKTLAEGNRLYLAVHQGIEQVQALKQAVQSGEEAVLGEKKGVQAGTRTFVDALDAERRMFESMRDYALAIYSLANNRMKFLALAGAMDIEAVETVNTWLISAKN